MDAIYKKWFDADSVEVTIELDNHEGFLSSQDIAALTGAPKNSKVLVRREEQSIAFIVSNDIFDEDMYRYLVSESDGLSLYINNAVMALKEQFTNQGIGPRCVIRKIFAATVLAHRVPIKFIKVEAVGNFDSFHWVKHPLRGYYVWASMGFDGKIPENVTHKLPHKYRHCHYVSELIQEDGGLEQWRLLGDTVKLFFDLAPDSTSWRLLTAYMNAKGIEP